jgi:hypothetical protein
MASMTNYAGYQLHLEMALNSSGTIPETYYAALLRASPSLVDGNGGNEVSSATNTWYIRKLITFDTASSAGRTLVNTSTVTFDTAADDAVSGAITHIGVYDAETSGNLWFVLPMTSPLTIGIGTPVIFPAGQLIHEWLAT